MKHVLQFKITLRGIKPPIWRRIQVPEDYSFWDLHVAIQSAMDGWDDHHLHLFTIPDRATRTPWQIGFPDDEEWRDEPTLAGWEHRIKQFFGLTLKRATYLYDFGDGWEHDLVLEAIMPAEKGKQYPVCIGGRRQCPPEDCGGQPGFAEFLAIMENPGHPDHRDMLSWHGEHFNPAEFSPEQVIFDDPDRRWDYCYTRDNGGLKLEDLVLPTRMRRMLARAGEGGAELPD